MEEKHATRARTANTHTNTNSPRLISGIARDHPVAPGLEHLEKESTAVVRARAKEKTKEKEKGKEKRKESDAHISQASNTALSFTLQIYPGDVDECQIMLHVPSVTLKAPQERATLTHEDQQQRV